MTPFAQLPTVPTAASTSSIDCSILFKSIISKIGSSTSHHKSSGISYGRALVAPTDFLNLETAALFIEALVNDRGSNVLLTDKRIADTLSCWIGIGSHMELSPILPNVNSLGAIQSCTVLLFKVPYV